jgi:hypothetical protein
MIEIVKGVEPKKVLSLSEANIQNEDIIGYIKDGNKGIFQTKGFIGNYSPICAYNHSFIYQNGYNSYERKSLYESVADFLNGMGGELKIYKFDNIKELFAWLAE